MNYRLNFTPERAHAGATFGCIVLAFWLVGLPALCWALHGPY